MTNSKLFIRAASMLLFLGALPHILPKFISLPELNFYDVEFFFYVFNDLSLIYIIVPFFILELGRYLYLKRLDKDVMLDSMSNVITFGAYLIIEYVLGILAITKIYYWVHMHFSLPYLPLNIFNIIFVILLADFAYYWDHRMMHRIGIGWATHTVHHSSEHFNMSVAYRFGPMDAIFPIIFSLPIVMLGFDPILVLSAEVFVQVFQTLLHTEIIKKLPRPFEFIFNTPSHHRVHHGSNREYWDKNYAGILIIWDRMFGTFEPEVAPVKYGISEPLNSVNPVKVFFHGITRFYQKFNNTSGFTNKLLLFIKPPDWSPKERNTLTNEK
ncbi:sterol desaturase family protein [bacterium SCSIO 12643]|nr:sterol desaturase family protein [bacterium SCSIO 12643]